MKKSIGILGGMGPLATADLYRKIVELTDAQGDAGHIRTYIDSNPAIPDRTAALLQGGEDPVPAMAESLEKLVSCGAECLLLPCNTAHCFLPRLQALTPVPFLSMPDAAAQAAALRFPGGTAAVLATRGTLASGLYQRTLAQRGVPFLVPDEAQQDALMEVIYGGVKAGAPPARYRAALEHCLEGLSRRGADYFLLGCTELPPAFRLLSLPHPAVDPTEELARSAIRFCGYQVKSTPS